MDTVSETVRLYEKAAEIESNKAIRLRHEEIAFANMGDIDSAMKTGYLASESFRTRNHLFKMIAELKGEK